MTSIIIFAFFAIPIAAFVYFICSLISFCIAKSANKRSPGSYSEEELKGRREMLIISSVIFGFLFTVILVLIILLYSAVAFM